MSKYHTQHTIAHDGETIPHGHVIELDDKSAQHLVERGHLVKASHDAEVTHHLKGKTPKAIEGGKGKDR